ncbi:MAG TPA: DoxX family membrane protein [Acidothermaceae bacterium]
MLKWLPGFRDGYQATIAGQADGQPGWLKLWFHFRTNLQSPHPFFFAYLVAVLESLIGVAVIIGFAREFTYLAAIVMSVLIWSTAEGLAAPTPPAPATSALPSSTHSSSRRCSASASTRAPPGREQTAVDPVCGMTVRLDANTIRSAYGGVDHAFCSVGCRDRFADDRSRSLPVPPPWRSSMWRSTSARTERAVRVTGGLSRAARLSATAPREESRRRG